MSRANLIHPLRGVVPPLVTPLLGSDELDRDGLEKLVEHVISGGVHGIFILGTTGEAPSLSARLQREMIDRTCKHVAGRVPVLVGATDASPVETRRLAEHAAMAGASAIVLAAPFYFPIDQSDLAEYFCGIIPQLPLPVFIYNMPTHTKIDFSADLVSRVMSLPNAVGLKDSSPGAACFHFVREKVQRDRPDFALLIGPEECMASCVAVGAHGGVCGGANVFPKLFVDLYNAAAAHDKPRVDQLQSEVLRLAKTVYTAGGGAGYAAIRAIKRSLCALGICSDILSPPMRPLTPEQRGNVDRGVRAMREAFPKNLNITLDAVPIGQVVGGISQ